MTESSSVPSGGSSRMSVGRAMVMPRTVMTAPMRMENRTAVWTDLLTSVSSPAP